MQGSPSNPVITAVRKFFANLKAPSEAQILVGVSGGVDSMVLLHVLKNLNYTVSAVHVNFQLRGKESDLDASHVEKWCGQNKIPFLGFAVDTKAYAASNGVNIQTAARDIRYKLWHDLYHSGKFDFVATAHHHDDAVETVLMNLLRGTGFKGLTGIPMIRDFYIRPLLRVSRTQIEQYASELEIPFRTDVSNESDAYFRNRIRHHLLPLIKKLSPDSDAILDQSLHRVRVEWDTWEHAYKSWVSDKVIQDDGGFTLMEETGKTAFILRWLEDQGFPWQLAYDYVTANNLTGGKELSYGHYSLTRTEDGFHFEKQSVFTEVSIDQPGTYIVGDNKLDLRTANREEFEFNDDPNVEFIDADKISWPLTCRNILPGDHFFPLGMDGHSKKLQDYLVDLKFEPHEKNRILLLLSSGQIVWVLGKRLDQRFSITPQTSQFLRMEFSKKGEARQEIS